MGNEPRPTPGTGWLLVQAHSTANREFTEALAALDLLPRHFGVLLQLARHEPRTQRELVELLSTDRSGMVRTIDELEDRGLVRRGRVERDRRAHAVTLTTRGRAMHRRAAKVAGRTADLLFGAMDSQEREQFDRMLMSVIEARGRVRQDR